jgi:hypothetical protein
MKRWSYLFDAAIIIAAVTGGLYYYGWRYTEAYYSFFGMGLHALSTDTPTLAVAAANMFLPIMLYMIYIATIIVQSPFDFRSQPATVGQALVQNSVPALLLAWLVGELDWLSSSEVFSIRWQYWLMVLALTVFVIVISRFGLSLTYGITSFRPPYSFVFVWVFVVMLGTISDHKGREAAMSLATGDQPRTLVTLHMRDSESWFNGRPMVLISRDNDAYYLTSIATDRNGVRLSYEIPVSEIRTATMVRDP